MTTAAPSSPAIPLAPRDAPAVPSHLEARRQMMQGLEAEFAALRRLDLKKRLHETLFFVLLWTGSMALNVAGYQLTPGFWHYTLRLAGTAGTAIAINTFILFMHEGMHGTLFTSRFWNRWVSVALGTTFCLSFTSYRVMHTRHHQYLGDSRDPDDYHNYTDNRLLIWLLHYFRLILGVYVYLVLIPILAFRYGSPTEWRRIVEEYLVLAAIYFVAAAVIPLDLLLFIWLIPLVIAAHMTAVRGLTQHGITNAQDPFLASRSIQASPLVAFCLLNENFHLEHHLFPEIPSYHLAEVHRLIWPRLPRVVTGKSYLVFLFRFFAATLKMDETPIGFTEMLGWEV